MKAFELGTNVIDKVLEELEKAEQFIKIAVFQIHLDNLFDLLERKVKQGLKIEIFTLPYDSINSPIREPIKERLEKLSSQGINLHFCKWNVGDPERTSTAIGRWYSFHGKFIVTDKSAIALSANFTQSNELDAVIITDEPQLLRGFVKSYDELLNLFITDYEGYDGEIRNKIIRTGLSNIENVFELPNIIQTTTHQNNWIKHYPALLCPNDIQIEEKLCISPFDVRGRNIYEKILDEAKKYIFISAESFTDITFGQFLRKIKMEKKINVCLLTGFTSMDFTDRIQKMYRELIADEIDIYTIESDLHAKLLITDKHLLIGSINLNKMNLGFNQTRNYWRENTETFFVTSNGTLIKDAKRKFENQINNSIRMEIKLAEKIQKDVSNILKKSFNVRSKKEVKELCSKFVLLKEIEVKKDTNKLVKIMKKLMNHYDTLIANRDTFVMAVILFYLQDRKHTRSEIKNKLDKLVIIKNLNTLLKNLLDSKFIEVEEDFYKINIETLFE